MKLYFKSIELVNFGSYSNAKITLENKNFCSVSGQNNFTKDNALSNGSGKSTIWSAICWVLTGETISGQKNNLKNINIEDNNCSATLSFNVDNDEFIITRYIAPKSDLKIFKNSIDISGKGIRESEKILADNLPDITKNLISSTILLGQGMPNKFSSFSPSGRKDLLETLTKSDFMIEDIKSRISQRKEELNNQLRVYEDSILANNVQLNISQPRLDTAKNDLANLSTINYQKEIDELTSKSNTLNTTISSLNTLVSDYTTENDELTAKILELTQKKAVENDEEFQAYSEAFNKYNSLKQTNLTSIAFEQAAINKVKSIRDICPTCGQKIPGVLKPDTTEEEQKIAEFNANIAELDTKINEVQEKHKKYLDQINSQYKSISEYQEKVNSNKLEITTAKTNILNYTTELNKITEQLNKLTYDKQNNENSIIALNKIIIELEQSINLLTNNNKLMMSAKLDIEDRLALNKQLETISKRDFRGYLLYNIVEYINNKAKEYSKIVFGTTELEIYLDNNALDISYCNKLYESLSGGEKQRVDLITQFAIRDLLQYYFNYSSNILVLDEITDNLDKIATNKIFDLITTKLNDIDSVFIISHHADELEIPVDSEIQVIKDKNGISYIKEM